MSAGLSSSLKREDYGTFFSTQEQDKVGARDLIVEANKEANETLRIIILIVYLILIKISGGS